MHLSLLSDSFLSDRLDDSGMHLDHLDRPTLGRSHRDGVIRGLCFLAALAIPVILALGVSSADTDAATTSGTLTASPAATATPSWSRERHS